MNNLDASELAEFVSDTQKFRAYNKDACDQTFQYLMKLDRFDVLIEEYDHSEFSCGCQDRICGCWIIYETSIKIDQLDKLFPRDVMKYTGLKYTINNRQLSQYDMFVVVHSLKEQKKICNEWLKDGTNYLYKRLSEFGLISQIKEFL